MPNGFGRGRGFGRGFRGGMGFGFRGASPPWPYVGIGRGGLPRCGYFLGGAGAYPAWPYPSTPFYEEPPAYEYGPSAGSMTKEEELSYLKDQAEIIKDQLENIDSRMRDLEAKE
jgi:hypothetical protein